jgi:hypothetical protein
MRLRGRSAVLTFTSPPSPPFVVVDLAGVAEAELELAAGLMSRIPKNRAASDPRNWRNRRFATYCSVDAEHGHIQHGLQAGLHSGPNAGSLTDVRLHPFSVRSPDLPPFPFPQVLPVRLRQASSSPRRFR